MQKRDKYVSFYQFWFWEYQRRNSEYQAAYEQFVKDLDQSGFTYNDISILVDDKAVRLSVAQKKKWHNLNSKKYAFFKKFGRFPTDYRDVKREHRYLSPVQEGNIDSDALLKDIICQALDNQRIATVILDLIEETEKKELSVSKITEKLNESFSYSVRTVEGVCSNIELDLKEIYGELNVIISFEDSNNLKFVKDNPMAAQNIFFPEHKFSIGSMMTKIITYKWPYLRVELNLSDDLDVLLKEISYIYNDLKLARGFVTPHYQNKMVDFLLNEKAKAEDLLFKDKKGLGGRGKAQRVLPRAVGLWLWDRWNRKEIKHGGKASVFKKFFLEFTDEYAAIFGDAAYIEEKHLRRILTRTTKCIEKVEVLPMK